MRTWRLALVGLLACLPLVAAGHAQSQAIRGAWEDVGTDLALKVEPHRLVLARSGQISILPVRDMRPGEVVVVVDGAHTPLPFAWDDDTLSLTLEPEGTPQHFERAGRPSPELQLQELANIGPSRELSAARVEAIQREIAHRLERDQAALSAETSEGAEAVLADNLAYLRKLVREIGWIDRTRFGAKTSYQALVLLKHGDDLPLILAVLPKAERDFRGDTDNPGAFPILLDSSRLRLGEKQVYGTQIETDETGQPVLAPLEEPGRVNARRAQQGLQPLEEYLSMASQMLFDGKAVRLPFKSAGPGPRPKPGPGP